MLTIPPMLGRHQIPCRIAACVAFVATLLVGLLAPPPAIAQQTSYVTWTEREYVYTPGYIDEFVAEYDAAGHHWPVLQDANFNAVALAHRDGRVARQRVLSPYGRVIQEDSTGFVTGSPATRIGHQGLFAERLDADTRQNPQAANGAVVWHNRQRTLHAEYGRFLQRDPLATGVTTPQTLWWHSGAKPIESAFSGRIEAGPMAMLLPNQYQYVLSQPGGLVDPTGGFPVDPHQAARIPGPGEVAMRGARAAGRGTAALGDRLGAVFVRLEGEAGRPSRAAGSALAVAKDVGRAVGATWAALALDGSLGGNRAYDAVMEGTIMGGGTAAIGLFGGLASGGSVVPGAMAGGVGALGAFALDGWDYTSLSGWGATLTAFSEFGLESGFGGLTTGAATPFAAGVALGAGFYSGAIEYAAESAFDWWK